MNTNGNIYTIVYSAIIVILVAAILAFASSALKPMQEANVKAETISQMLDAAGIQEKGAAASNEEILDKYAENIEEAFAIGLDGQNVRDLSIVRDSIELIDGLKAQNTNISKDADKAELPIYKFKNGTTVIPVYGGGLWGPVWGYVAFKEDLKTIAGAYFDHESETPGLGAKIKDDPAFRELFKGKVANFTADPAFAIVKGAGGENEVDAITGATMTSKGLSGAIKNWFAAYSKYFLGNVPTEAETCCEGCEGNCEGCCEENKTEEE